MRFNNIILSGLLVAGGMFSCVTFEPITLNEFGDAGKPAIIGTSALTTDGGDLLNNYEWTSKSAALTVDKDQNQLVLQANNARKGYATVFAEIKDLDFRGDLAIKVRARAEGGTSPKLSVELMDDKGLVGNERNPDHSIHIGEDFRNYYFTLNGSFYQTAPVKEVNAARIQEVRLAINRIGERFSGKIYIDEISVVLGKEIIPGGKLVEIGKSEGVAADFVNGVKDFSVDKSIEGYMKDGAFVVKGTHIGPAYESFEFDIETINMSESPKLKVKVRATGDSDPILRLDLIDGKGTVTNYLPTYQLIKSGEEFTEYIFDYTDRFNQSYPLPIEVDPYRIVKIRGYVNPGWNQYTGTVEIQSIEIQ